MAITKTPSADRPLYKRWTVIGVALIGVIQALEAEHLIPMGFTDTLANYGEIGGAILVSLGLYRHIPTT